MKNQAHTAQDDGRWLRSGDVIPILRDNSQKSGTIHQNGNLSTAKVKCIFKRRVQKMKKRGYTTEDLLEIIAAQEELIAELLERVGELEDRIAKRRKPAVVENGVLVQLERFVVI